MDSTTERRRRVRTVIFAAFSSGSMGDDDLARTRFGSRQGDGAAGGGLAQRCAHRCIRAAAAVGVARALLVHQVREPELVQQDLCVCMCVYACECGCARVRVGWWMGVCVCARVSVHVCVRGWKGGCRCLPARYAPAGVTTTYAWTCARAYMCMKGAYL